MSDHPLHPRQRGTPTNSIGGFFELELIKGKHSFHKDAIALSTGRACISLMIEQLKPSKIFLPYYTCDATLEPFKKYSVPFEYYNIDLRLFPGQIPKLSKGEFFLYTNYFGIKNNEADKLMKIYGDKLILDDTHAFFLKRYNSNWSFTSARKYFGVPDGAYLYAPVKLKTATQYSRFTNISLNHSLNRLLGNNEVAYRQYTEYEKSLNADIHAISSYSEAVLSQIDYSGVIKKRNENFSFLHSELKSLNQLEFDAGKNAAPFCYPFLPASFIDKSILHENNFFIPSYWLEVLNRNTDGFETEKMLSKELLPLPVDHRYNISDMSVMVSFIKKILDGK